MKTNDGISLVLGLLILIFIVVEVYTPENNKDCFSFEVNAGEEYKIPRSVYSLRLETVDYITIPGFYPYGLATITVKENEKVIESFQIKGDSECPSCKNPIRVKNFLIYLTKVDKKNKNFGEFRICFDRNKKENFPSFFKTNHSYIFLKTLSLLNFPIFFFTCL